MERPEFLICVSFLIMSFTASLGAGYSNPAPQPQYGVPGHTPGQPLGLGSQEASSGQYSQNQGSSCPPSNPEVNKQMIIRLYNDVLGPKNVSTIEQYFAEDTLEHNPYVADGRAARRETLISGTISGPPVNIEIQRVIADGDYVWIHSRFPIDNLKSVFAAVDIYRIECGLIREHWDVLQNIKLNMPSLNPHPFF